MTAYQDLEQRFTRLSSIENAASILEWDAETMMPSGALPGRLDQLAALKLLAREIIAAPEIGDLLAEASDDRNLSNWQAGNVREMQRRYVSATAVPKELLEAATRAAATCQHVWRKARKDSDFAAVSSHLADVLRTQKEVGEALGSAMSLPIYDALIDKYDPGSTEAWLDALFAPLGRALPGLIADVLAHQGRQDPPLALEGPFPQEAQEKLCRRVMDAVGFDFDRGRLDVSTHPFTGGAVDDVRITTRYDTGDFLSGLLAVVHESGHGLYEQGRPPEWRTQPVGESRGMGPHESQSLILEMQVGRSGPFMEFLAPMAREVFGRGGPAWTPANLGRLTTTVKPGLIRVEADEVTYPAHILLRYRIEKAMITGALQISDLPGAFNDAVKEMLGLEVPDDRRGCLQDIHWYGGAWGYFPAYLVGAVTAAQLYVAASKALPDLSGAIARGEFAPLVKWLRESLHRKASLLDTRELVRQATGQELGVEAYQRHLRSRYLN